MLAFLIPMPSDASKNLPKSEIRQFRTLYLSIVTAGSNPEVSVLEVWPHPQIQLTLPRQ